MKERSLDVNTDHLPPALLRKLPMNLLGVFMELFNDRYFLEVLWHQSAISSDGLLEHTRIDK
jgi:hypothetical protein